MFFLLTADQKPWLRCKHGGISLTEIRRSSPDEFVFGVLDYYFAVGVWVFGVGVLGFWAWDEFWGRIVTDSSLTPWWVQGLLWIAVLLTWNSSTKSLS